MLNFIKQFKFAFQVKTILLFINRFGIGFEEIRVLYKYITASLFASIEDDVHLKAAIKWLAHSQDVDRSDDGSSSAFYFKSGWDVSYPETSGYIISTYLAYAKYSGNHKYIERAIAIGDWEIEIQSPSGGVYSSPNSENIRVFNTGQVILGWCDLYETTTDQKYLDAAIRAGNYLALVQEEDGSWIKDTFGGARTYEARVDWALLRVFQLTDNVLYQQTAIKNLHWVLDQQHENGWFDNCGFHDELPIMHTIIYTLRGLLECELIEDESVKDLMLMSAVRKSVDSLCNAIEKQSVNGVAGMVPSAFDKNWKGVLSDSCLTGNVQFACLLYRLSHEVNSNYYCKIADLVLDVAKQTQIVNTSLKDIDGALPGSYPIYKGYVHDGYPNWATKFLADALLMKINYRKKMVVKA